MTKLSTRPRTIPSWSVEYILWIFMRVSGVAMITIAIIGAIGAFWMGARNQLDLQMLWRWMFMPNTYHISSGDIPDLEPWANAWWQTMQLLVVFFGVTHAFNGVRQVIEDYVGRSWLRLLIRSALFVLWLVMVIIGWQLIQGNILV